MSEKATIYLASSFLLLFFFFLKAGLGFLGPRELPITSAIKWPGLWVSKGESGSDIPCPVRLFASYKIVIYMANVKFSFCIY